MLVLVVFIFAALGFIPDAAAETKLIAQYQGQTEHGGHCQISLLEDIVDGEDPVLQFLIAGPRNAGNFDFKLNPEKLPLKENKTYSVFDGGEILYKDGVLTYIEDRDLGLLNFTDEITEIQLEVDPDLRHPRYLEVRLYEQFLWNDGQPVKTLICEF